MSARLARRPAALTLALASALTASVAHADPRSAVAFPAPPDFVLDGRLDEWRPGAAATSPVLDLHPATAHVQVGTLASGADHSAQVWLGHTPTALRIAVRVVDDHVVAAQRAGEIWRDDLIEFVLAAREDATIVHIGISARGEVHVFGADRRALPRVAALRHAQGWQAELEVPFTLLGVPQPDSLRLNIAAKDVDPGETPAAQITWSGVRHTSAASLGWLLLRELARAEPPAGCPLRGDPVLVSSPLRVGPQGALLSGAVPLTLRLANYQGAELSWLRFWDEFDLAVVRRDLERAAAYGFNALRIFMFFEALGGPPVRASLLRRLGQTLEAARRAGLLVVVTFFPFKKEFRPERYAEMEVHLRTVVSAFRDDPTIAMWDLMNEPDHAWALSTPTATRAEVDAWTTRMLATVRAADPTHLVTVGLAGHAVQRGFELKTDPAYRDVDVISVHWYDRPLVELEPALRWIREQFPQTPLILQELGVSSLFATDHEVRRSIAQACEGASRSEVRAFGLWELYDHPQGSIGHLEPRWQDTAENHFGMLRPSGEAKGWASSLCACLSPTRLAITAPGGRP